MNENLMREFLKKAMSEAVDVTVTESRADKKDMADKVARAAETYLKPNRFSIGQLIQWKPGMRNNRQPKYGVPAVIIEIDDNYRMDGNSGTTHENEPTSIRCGFIDDDGMFEAFWQDANRFEPYEV